MPEPVHGPIVIIGAGQAGMQLASGLRQLGSAAPVTLIGEEPYPPYERPPLSKAFLKGELEQERLLFRHEKAYREQEIVLRTGTHAVAIDRRGRRVRTADGDEMPYAACVIATGARARRLDVPGAELSGVEALRTLDDAKRLRAATAPGFAVAVVGGGYIGMEIAASLTALGAVVTVIEAAPRIMSRGIAPVVADHVADRHRAAGVRLETGTGVAGFVGEEQVRAVKLADGREIAASLVVVGIGAAINDEIGAAAGLPTDGGLLTDACARTEDPAIFAIGDVAVQDHAFLGRRVRLESVQNAVDQAKAVARTLATGQPAAMAEVPWFWTQQYDMMIQMAGFADPTLEWVLRGEIASGRFAAYGLADGVIAAVQAVNSGTDYALGRRLVRGRVRAAPDLLADTGANLKSLLPARPSG